MILWGSRTPTREDSNLSFGTVSGLSQLAASLSGKPCSDPQLDVGRDIAVRPGDGGDNVPARITGIATPATILSALVSRAPFTSPQPISAVRLLELKVAGGQR